MKWYHSAWWQHNFKQVSTIIGILLLFVSIWIKDFSIIRDLLHGLLPTIIQVLGGYLIGYQEIWKKEKDVK